MKRFSETEISRRIMDDYISAHGEFYERELTDEEKAIAEQKTVFYKAWCGLVYGHLEKKGVCLRCGKLLNKK